MGPVVDSTMEYEQLLFPFHGTSRGFDYGIGAIIDYSGNSVVNVTAELILIRNN